MVARRPLFWLCVSFICGIALQARREQGLLLMILVAAALALCFVLRRSLWRQDLHWFWPLLALLAGLGYAETRWQALPQPLAAEFDGSEALLHGTVAAFPQRQGDDWVLELERIVLEIEGQRYAQPGRLRLRIYPQSETAEQSGASVIAWQPGDSIEATVKLRRYQQGRNFGDPDWSLLFRRRGICGSASCADTQIHSLVREEGFNLQLMLWRARQSVAAAFLGPEQGWMLREWAELLSGITIGLNDELPAEWDEAFRQAGVVHLLVVSGGHFVVLMVFVRRFLRLIPMSLRLEQLLLLLAIIGYTLLTGAQPPVLRAGVTAVLALAAEILQRRTEWPSLLLLSMFILLLHNPFMLFEAGFQLSYLSVAGICLWSPTFLAWLKRLRLPNFLALGLAITLAAQLAVLPLGVQLFNQVSLIAPLSNLICAALLAPLQLLAVMLLLLYPLGVVATAWLAMLLQGLLWLFVQAATITAALPGAVWNVPSPGWPLLFLSYAFMLTFTFAPRRLLPLRYKVLLVCGISAVILVGALHPWPYPLQVVMLDVGQGDSLFVRFPNGRTMLVDGGGSPLYTSDSGRRTIIPFLRRQGVQALDLAVISHPHEDHFQGVLQVVDYFPVRALAGPNMEGSAALPEELRLWLDALEDGKYRPLQAGQILNLDLKVQVEVSSVGDLLQEASFNEINNASVVLRIEYGRTVLWLTGDAETPIEEALLSAGINEEGKHVVLKVAHHGSRNATSALWLEALRPVAALISAGENNSFGHPTPEVLQRLSDIDCTVLRSDLLGAVRLVSDGSIWQAETALPWRER